MRPLVRAALLVVLVLLAVPSPAEAIQGLEDEGVRLVSRPPVGSKYGFAGFNCGWHDTCRAPYPDGMALDWGRGDNHPALIWRAYGWRDGTKSGDGSISVARLDVADAGTGCEEIQAQVTTYADPVYRATRYSTFYYQHANLSSGSASYTIRAARVGAYNAVRIGSLKDDPACKGYNHVHEDRLSSRNSDGALAGNARIPTAVECRQQTNDTDAGCATAWDVYDPGEPTSEEFPNRERRGDVYWVRYISWTRYEQVCDLAPACEIDEA